MRFSYFVIVRIFMRIGSGIDIGIMICSFYIETWFNNNCTNKYSYFDDFCSCTYITSLKKIILMIIFLLVNIMYFLYGTIMLPMSLVKY